MRIMHKLEVQIIIYNLKMQIAIWNGISRRDYARNDSAKKSTELLDPCFFLLF